MPQFLILLFKNSYQSLFTVLYLFQVYREVNQLYIHIYSLVLDSFLI